MESYKRNDATDRVWTCISSISSVFDISYTRLLKMIQFLYHPNFEKQFEKLKKKYPSLHKDFEVFCLARESDPVGYEPNIVRI